MITRNDDMATELRENMRGGTGTVKLQHWFKPEAFGAKIRLCTRMTLAPGCSIGSHTHENEDEIYLVLSGSGRIEENGQWVPIGPGDAILTGKGGTHGVENNGTVPLVIAAIIVLY
ncbi:MAG TPA: cupin domain-containing protein [Kiritimatiellia bacterium]|mgnify:CR=1 FL=1|nr:cupin domain-containing protein [Kiritimatiellia bacterium]HPS06598.1 cupin domain-containing protein [Kiritimatiellia bacterium]